MRGVLFYTENFSGRDSKGGTEVATYRIAKALKESGKFRIYNAFRHHANGSDSSIYQATIKLGKGSSFVDKLSEFIRDNQIDVVVNMTRFFRHNAIIKGVDKSGRQVKIIFMQHFAPGSEFKKATFKSGLHLLKLNPFNPLYWLRASVYPLIKLPRNKRLSQLYRTVYDTSNHIVLLSEDYKEEFGHIGKFNERDKFISIPNIFETQEKIPDKKKQHRVLILSRMDEIQKRLSLALKIWSNIEDDPDLSHWHLDIVGEGHNTDIVKRLIKKYGLEHVTLHGWQDRKPFLENSSILMMTSEYEGLPLTLLEAQAYGVVPIAFDSFASLKDVVTPYQTGVVVKNFGDIEDYTKKLTELMYDGTYREELSQNAKKNIENFSTKNIAEQWLKILT